MKLAVREITLSDTGKIVDYFIDATPDFITGMGVEINKLPKKGAWIQTLKSELTKPYKEKKLYYIIWLLDEEVVGHSNINHIEFGKVATMHLHVWDKGLRKSGLGSKFLRMTIPLYFQNLKIEKLICEPYSQNIPPNRTLKKFGFDLIRTYETIPGPINYRQVVNRYELTKARFNEIIK